jgi:fumarate reductase subunit D
MKNQPANKKIRIAVKWIIRVVVFQLILINISAAFHAHRITHYYDDVRVRNLSSSSLPVNFFFVPGG